MKKHFRIDRVARIDNSIDFIHAFKIFLPQLKKTGSNYRCICPFHKEKTPSFFVSVRKNMWHCFSCGIGGKGIISYVMKKNDMQFIEALEYIETTFGITDNVSANVNVMKSSLKNLKMQVKEKRKLSYTRHETLNKIYENKLIKFAKKISKKYKDTTGIMQPYIESMWAEFDVAQFKSYEHFKSFVKKWYSILSTQRRVIKSVKELVKTYE